MKGWLLVLCSLLAGCAGAAAPTAGPSGSTTTMSATTQVRKPILTPIPGVSTAERLLAIATCTRGLTSAGLNVASIEDAADEQVVGEPAKSRAAVARRTLSEARAAGVTEDVIKACGQMLDNAARAREIRATQAPGRP